MFDSWGLVAIRKRIVLAVFLTLSLSSYAMEKAPDFRDEVRPWLETKRVYPDLISSPDTFPEAKRELARRVAGIVTDAVAKVIWIESEGMSEARKRWRQLAIDSVWVTVYIRLISSSNEPVIGLTTNRIDVVKGIAERSARFVADYCSQRQELASVPFGGICQNVQVLTTAAVQEWAAPDLQQQARLQKLSSNIVTWAAANWLNSQSLMRMVRLLEHFPESESIADLSAAEARILKQHPDACYEIGSYVSSVINTVSQHSLKGAKRVATNFANSLIPNKSIGAKILAGIEDILIDEKSRAIPLAEATVRILSAPPLVDSTVGASDLEKDKAEFKAFLDTKLPNLIRNLLENKEDGAFKRALKGWAGSAVTPIVEELKPLIMDLTCNDDGIGAQHLLLHYLPPVFCAQIHKDEDKVTKVNTEATEVSTGLGRVAEDIAQTYLWKEAEESQLAFRQIFIKALQATTEQIAYKLLSGEQDSDANANAVRTARTLTALHLFFEDLGAIKKKVSGAKFRVPLDENIDQPVIDLTTHILKLKYPHEVKDIHERVHRLMRHGSAAFFETIIDPVTVLNLVSNFDFPDQVTVSPPTSTASNVDPAFHAPFGQAAIRALRSFLKLSGQLGLLNASLVGILNAINGSLGKKILEGDSGNYVKSINQLLFKQGGEHIGKARPFVDWVTDQAALDNKFDTWVKMKLTPFLRAHIEALAPLGTQTAAGLLIANVVPSLAFEIKAIIASENQRLLKILLFYYILPIWRDDIIAAAMPKAVK